MTFINIFIWHLLIFLFEIYGYSQRTVKVSAALLKCHFSSHFCCVYFYRDIFSSCNFINNFIDIVQRNRLNFAMLWILYLKWSKHRILHLFEWYEIIKLVYIFFSFFFCGQSDYQNYLSQFIGGSALFLIRFTSWWWKAKKENMNWKYFRINPTLVCSWLLFHITSSKNVQI